MNLGISAAKSILLTTTLYYLKDNTIMIQDSNKKGKFLFWLPA